MPRIKSVQAEIDALTAEIPVHPASVDTLGPEEVEELVAEFAQTSRQIFGPDADPGDLYDFFSGINLWLVYDQPAGRLDAEINLGPQVLSPHSQDVLKGGGGKDRVRGGT